MKPIVKKPSFISRVGLLSLVWALSSPAPAASAYHSLADIQQTAVAYVLDQADQFPVPPRVSAGKLDHRLRLARCSQPLSSFESPGGLSGGHAVVGVRCNGNKPWKLFVPVDIELPAEVVVLARPMRRGDVITAADLGSRQMDLANLRNQFYRDPAGLIGQRFKRHVAANAILTPSMIAADRLVERGTRVTILSDAGPIQVRVAGKALEHGGRGDQIKVKNQASGRTISAVVVDQGVVMANP